MTTTPESLLVAVPALVGAFITGSVGRERFSQRIDRLSAALERVRGRAYLEAELESLNAEVVARYRAAQAVRSLTLLGTFSAFYAVLLSTRYIVGPLVGVEADPADRVLILANVFFAGATLMLFVSWILRLEIMKVYISRKPGIEPRKPGGVARFLMRTSIIEEELMWLDSMRARGDAGSASAVAGERTVETPTTQEAARDH